VIKFVPEKTLHPFSLGKLTFKKRVVVHRVAGEPWYNPLGDMLCHLQERETSITTNTAAMLTERDDCTELVIWKKSE
jgi:hypothetical protein